MSFLRVLNFSAEFRFAAPYSERGSLHGSQVAGCSTPVVVCVVGAVKLKVFFNLGLTIPCGYSAAYFRKCGLRTGVAALELRR